MPSVRLFDAMRGDCVTITTSDPKTLATWLTEWVPQMVHPNGRTDVRFEAWPWSRPDGTPDWPVRKAGYGEAMTDAELERVQAVLQAIADDREKARA